jgi:hypothetical protein
MQLLLTICVLSAPAAGDHEFQFISDTAVVIKTTPLVVAGKTIGALEPGDDVSVQEDGGSEIKITFYPPDPFAEPRLVSISKQNIIPANKAIEHFNRVVEAEPENTAWRYARAKALIRQNKNDKAAADLTVAVWLNPRRTSCGSRRPVP